MQGDCFDQASLQPALAGVHTAYYLVHSMGSSGKFEEEDRQAARNFAASARQAGVHRIIYLGGLGAEGQSLSAHLRSRQEVADILRSSGVPTIEFRASIVIGSGSLSFEMIRALVQRLPVMICPRWVGVKAQPIAVEDVIAYLLQALELPVGDAAVFEIGGADQVSYGDIMQEYARQCGLRRCISLLCQASTYLRMGSKFRCIRSTPTEMQSISENDFECLASTGVNTPETMFPSSDPRILDFPEADFWTAPLFWNWQRRCRSEEGVPCPLIVSRHPVQRTF